MVQRLLRRVRTLAEVIRDPAQVNRHRFYSVRRQFYDDLWRQSAASLGAEVEDLGHGIKSFRRGHRMTLIRRSDLMLDSELAKHLFADKPKTLGMLALRGLPTPRHEVVDATDVAAARMFLAAAPGAIVVKPASGTGAGRGVTTGITGDEALRAALDRVARHGPTALIEDHVTGASFRLTFLNGDFLEAVRRDPPQVIGDGRKSIKTLMAEETRQRLAAQPVTALSPLETDADCATCLAAQGLDPDHVPAPQQAITVKSVVNQNSARENCILAAGAIHPEILEASRDLIADLGIGFAGIDILAPDLSRPLADTGGVFGEINVNPGIHHHHLVETPAPGGGLAATILERLLDGGRGGITLCR